MASGLRGAFSALASLTIAIAAASLCALVGVLAWQVFGRYVLNSSPSWTEPRSSRSIEPPSVCWSRWWSSTRTRSSSSSRRIPCGRGATTRNTSCSSRRSPSCARSSARVNAPGRSRQSRGHCSAETSSVRICRAAERMIRRCRSCLISRAIWSRSFVRPRRSSFFDPARSAAAPIATLERRLAAHD